MRSSANRIGTRSLLLACALAFSLLAAIAPVTPAGAAVVTDRSLLFSFDGSDTTAGHLVKPNKIAVDNSSGAVYVGEGEAYPYWSLNNAISKFNADGTAADFSATGASALFGPPGDSFGTRVGIAVDNSGGANQGRLYVGDRDHSRLIAFAPDGSFLWETALPTQIYDVAVDTNGHPWLLLEGSAREYANTGNPPAQIASFAVEGSDGIDVDAGGNVYVASFSGVKKYVGGVLDSTLDPAPSPDVYTDQSSASGHVFVIHSETGAFNEYDSSGALVGSFATNGAIDAAHGIAYNPTLDRVYVANDGANIVEALGPSATGTVPDPAIEATTTSGPGTATFHGTINPQSVANAYYFEWSDNTFNNFYGRLFRSPLQSLPEDSSAHAVQYKATNLQGNLNWQVRLVAVNTASGLRAVSGNDEFKSPKAAANPIVVIANPTAITATNAHISGTVNPKEDATRWQVEYTTDPACNPSGAWQRGTDEYLAGGEINTPQGVEYVLKELQPAQHYCVRLRANNSFDLFGPGSVSEIKQFDTPVLPPSEVSTAFAAPRTDTSARLNGRVNPEGNADFKYQFEWSEDGSTWTALPIRESSIDATEPIVVSDELTELKPDTTYHYRLAFAENETPPATLGGQEKTFTTRTAAEMELPQRGIEMVNNPDTGNQTVFLLLERHLPYMSSDGDRVLWAVTGGAPGSYNGVFAQFLSERTPSGWNSKNAIPPADQQFGEGRMRYELDAASPDLAHFTARIREPGYQVSEETLARLDDHENQEVLQTFGWGKGEEGLGQIDMTSDGAHVITVDTETKQLVDVGSGSPELLSTMPGGGSAECGVHSTGYTTAEVPQWRIGYHWIATTDANLVYFRTQPNGECSARLGLYVHDRETEETTLISPGANGKDAEFIRASLDGRIAFFISAAQLDPADANEGRDIYRWNQDTGEASCLTCMVPDAAVANNESPLTFSVLVSDDLSHVYFRSHKRLIAGRGVGGGVNVYEVSGGTLRFVTTLGSEEGLNKQSAKLSADGNVLVFSSKPGKSRMTADSVSCKVECQQLYRYDDRDDSLECISCLHGATTTQALSDDAYSGGFDLSADGKTVAFTTGEDLVARDVNHTQDVYEWRDGALRLITDGVTEIKEGGITSAPGVWGISDDGSNILFAVAQPGLTGFEQNRLRNLYDARIGGGFEPPGPPVHCSGDSCQGPLVPAPEAGKTASSSFSGYGNEKHSSTPRRPCAKKRGKAKQRCVRKHKRHSQKARANDNAGRTK